MHRHWRENGAGGGAQRLGLAAAAQRAVVVLEFVRRTGGFPAQPQRLNAVRQPPDAVTILLHRTLNFNQLRQHFLLKCLR